ncbi:MAG TPA: branched-chain amino acid ABC transporter permease, partial [Ruminococcaceae bacterium]|nr:branched-chain amino acid ABC transporter permease [Oscillospiraceae bacterium]
MLNFAHGDIIMVGAYAILTSLQLTGNPYLAMVVSILVCTIAGVVIERLAYKPLRGASPLAVLITAIGVSFYLQAVAQLIYGSKSQSIALPTFGKVTVAGYEINVSTVITLVVGGVIMAGLTLFVKKTNVGRAMQAVSEDKGAALLMGVNVNRIIMITFAIGSMLAAFASLFYLMQIPSITPTLGSMPG